VTDGVRWPRRNATSSADRPDGADAHDGAACAEIVGDVAPAPDLAEARRAAAAREARIRHFIEKRLAERVVPGIAIGRRDGDAPNFFRRCDGFIR